MGKTLRDVLVRALENLEKNSFKKFKNKLNDWDIEKGYDKIPRGTLEGADPEDVADLIRRYYRDSYGMAVTLAVLEAIHESQEARELQEALHRVNCPTTTGEDQGATSGAPIQETSRGATSGDMEHFVDRHRDQLIQRAAALGPVLDDLLQYKVLTQDQYAAVCGKTTSEEQMRELYRYVPSWGNDDKDLFLQSLRRHEAPHTSDLEQSTLRCRIS